MKKLLILLVILAGLISCSSDKAKSLDINNQTEITNFLQGKWRCDVPAHNLNFRFLIEGNKIKLWEKIDTQEWSSTDQPEAERSFTLSQPTKDSEGYYHIRYLQFDQGDLPLSFRSVDPIWVICDKEWGEPAIMYGGGLTSFTSGWK